MNIDMDKLKALMAAKKQSMKRVERAKGFNPGKNRIRIALGWRAGEEHVWYHDFGQHFVKDAADQIQAVYLCTDATYGKPCEVCSTLRTALKHTHDDHTSKILAKAAAGKSILINAFHLDSDQPNTPQVTTVKPKLFGQLIEMLEENGPDAFFSLTEGHEIVVNRDGKGLDTTYTATMAIKKGTPIPAAAMKNLTNLDEYVKQESEEQQRKAIGAINTVAGFLPAPGTPATKPSELGLAAPAGRSTGGAATAAADFEDVPDLDARAATKLALDAEFDDLMVEDPS